MPLRHGQRFRGNARLLPDEIERVSSWELFFDLVFVFTLTQLTEVLIHDLTPVGAFHVLLMFGVIWWMYGAYAWLTNTFAPNTTGRRLLLLLSMVGFLTMSLAIPHAFDGDAIAFGVGYMIVVVIHASLFALVNKAILRLAPLNVLSASLVLIGGFFDSGVREALWATAVAVQFATSYVSKIGDFRIVPGHFVERHGLLMIVALGESIVAIGIGLSGHEVDPALIAAATLGLGLTTCLWWAYFTGDPEGAELALTRAAPSRRPYLALHGFFYAYIPMLLGIVCMAAGLTLGIGHTFDPLDYGSATVLAGGVSLFLTGDVIFRVTLGLRGLLPRIVAAAFALATIPLAAVTTFVQLIALLGVLVAMLFYEGTREPVAT